MPSAAVFSLCIRTWNGKEPFLVGIRLPVVESIESTKDAISLANPMPLIPGVEYAVFFGSMEKEVARRGDFKLQNGSVYAILDEA